MAFIKKSNQPLLSPITIKTWDDLILDAKNKNICLMPFDIYAYVDTFDNIEVINDDLSCEISGLIEYSNIENSKGFIIAINKYHSYERRRFTLAHEFAHYAMHREYIIKNKKIIDNKAFFRDRQSEIENEANEFASKLLMPKDEFIEAIKSGKKRLGDLAEHFCVTAAVVKYKASKLNLI